MATPIIHIAGGSLIYLLAGDLNIDRIYIIIGIVLLSTLPDFDFLIPGPHRCFSHSLVFCLLITAAVGSLTSFSYLTVFTLVVSHLLLDSFADGWSTVSWLWPFKVYKSTNTYPLSDMMTLIKDCLRVF